MLRFWNILHLDMESAHIQSPNHGCKWDFKIFYNFENSMKNNWRKLKRSASQKLLNTEVYLQLTCVGLAPCEPFWFLLEVDIDHVKWNPLS